MGTGGLADKIATPIQSNQIKCKHFPLLNPILASPHADVDDWRAEMKRTTLLAVAALVGLAACANPQPVTGRADNDLLRFSAMDYASQKELLR